MGQRPVVAVFQLPSHVWLFVTPWTVAGQVSLSLTISEVCPNSCTCIGDAIQPSHPLILPSPALSLSQHQGLFQWVGCFPQMTKILELQLHHQSFRQVFRVDFPEDWLVWPPVQGTFRSLLFDVMVVQMLYSSSRSHTLNLHLSWARNMQCNTFTWYWAAAGEWTTAPNRPRDHKGK